MNRHPTPMKARIVMWAAIAGSLALLGVLLALGWGDGAWTAAAGMLLLSCVFVCIWGAAQGRIADREVHRAVARIAATRQEEARRRSPRRGSPMDDDVVASKRLTLVLRDRPARHDTDA